MTPYFKLVLLSSVCLGFTLSSMAGGHRANGLSVAGNQVFVTLGPDATSSQGDFISNGGLLGLGSPHRFFIEVPDSGVTVLNVDIFDADILGGTPGDELALGLDAVDPSPCTYSLFPPTGILPVDVDVFTGGPGGGEAAYHNTWQTLFTVPNPVPGHWEVVVEMTQDLLDIDNGANAYGIRAYELSPNPAVDDTELNIYYEMGTPGITTNSGGSSRAYNFYPWIVSGAEIISHDFDFDDNGGAGGLAYSLTSPSLTFTRNVLNNSVSGDDDWNSEVVSGWVGNLGVTGDDVAANYGIWSMNLNVRPLAGSNNYTTMYMSYDSNTLPPPDLPNPASSSPVGVHRVYLPTDANTAPLKPYMYQVLDVPGGTTPNPLQVGVPTDVRVRLNIVNPTPHPISFTGLGKIVRSTLPLDPRTAFAGFEQATHGSPVGLPTLLIFGIGGDIEWDPGVIPPNTRANISYFIRVVPTAVGQEIPITGSISTGGTRGLYNDETADLLNILDPRSEYIFGPLAELNVTSDTDTLSVELDEFLVLSSGPGSPIRLEWTTATEIDNAGFFIYRAVQSQEGAIEVGERLNQALIPGQGTSTSSSSYSYTDNVPLASDTEFRGYYLEDINLNGQRDGFYGPFVYDPARQATLSVKAWQSY